jgi:protein disulfide-isomerase
MAWSSVQKVIQMKNMKRIFAWLVLAVTGLCTNAGAEWLTDYHAALDKANAEHKFVMLDFTGSDWCGWCMKLKAEVFDKPEFDAFAKENLVLVEVDFPQRKHLSAEQQAANDALARNFNIRGYPTILLLDASGNVVGHTGYMSGGPQAFIALLEKIPGMKHVDGSNVAKAEEPEPPRRPPGPFVPIPPTKPNYYAELALKAISGAPGQRMAQINNQTLMVGETGKVRVRDTKVEVVCKEIRDDSVLITVDGKPMELKLGAKPPPQKTAQK